MSLLIVPDDFPGMLMLLLAAALSCILLARSWQVFLVVGTEVALVFTLLVVIK